MSLFITFEGTEGSGKTTQIRELGQWFEQRGFDVLLTREPGGCSISNAIRSILLDSANREMTGETELLLYAAARCQHVQQIISPALEAGRVVLCDRFTDATLAYQGWGRNLPREQIRTLNAMATGGVGPQLTFLLDLPVERGLERALNRIAATEGPREDRFEQERLEFHRNVQRGYHALAEAEPQRFRLIDADAPPPLVASRIQAAMLAYLEARPDGI